MTRFAGCVGATKLADVPARTGLAAGEMCKLAP
jgi:hypothetical protein